ncbi:DCD1 (YHR144C) [Zygosaccharomyces parabailii]|nr:DCD1 (YHR144C) [Zygosaccharomyces parabailii]CDH09188.1 probable Deoxycytidylate deaminase [Zygosaccharomyces bailii ISA1307]
MFVLVSGTKYSGVEIAIQELVATHGFKQLDDNTNEDELIEYATKNYSQDLVMRCETLKILNKLDKRPSVIHISLDASVTMRLQLFEALRAEEQSQPSLFELLSSMDNHDFEPESLELRERSHIKIKIVGEGIQCFHVKVSKVIENQLKELREPSDKLTPPLRPSWDTYFMKLATLAASRSNCMKRKVGCVIVRECRVIATGYNGTPRHLTNCFNGGCPRCNDGEQQNLHTCLCLHAEENALLEAGRDRVGANATLYCDTCPCLTCSVKIVQTGITEVVYSQTYRMDEASFKVLKAAGIKVRQFSFLKDPRIVIV